MAFEPLDTLVTYHQGYGNKPGNITLEGCRFYGRPNFQGELRDHGSWQEDKRNFTVLIPNEEADRMRDLRWPVKTNVPTDDEKAQGREPLSYLKSSVFFSVDKNPHQPLEEQRYPDIWVIQGDDREKLTFRTVGLMDTARFDMIDMELRLWEYKPDQWSATLVTLVAVMRTSRLSEKYGRLL
jgi:hypothetical protein